MDAAGNNSDTSSLETLSGWFGDITNPILGLPDLAYAAQQGILSAVSNIPTDLGLAAGDAPQVVSNIGGSIESTVSGIAPTLLGGGFLVLAILVLVLLIIGKVETL